MTRPRWADYKEFSAAFGRACYEVDLENWRRAQNLPPEPPKPKPDAPRATVEAVMYELREDGAVALKVPNCQRRIGELSKRQLVEVLGRLLKLRPRYPKISDDLLLYIEGLAK
jgi:hypothetical protein